MDEHSVGFRDAFRILWRRKLVCAVIALAFALGSGWHSHGQPRLFQATSRIVVRPGLPQAALTTVSSTRDTGPLGLDLSTDTQADLVASTVIAERVAKKLPEPIPVETLVASVRATKIGDQLISIDAVVPKRKNAPLIANAFAEEFLSYRREQVVSVTNAIASSLLKGAAGIQKRVDSLNARISTLAAQIAVLPQPAPPVTSANSVVRVATSAQARLRASKEAEQQRDVSERDELLRQQSVLRARADDLRVGTIVSAGAGDVTQLASLPTAPVSPKPLRDAAVALVVGAVLAIGGVFLREFLDGRIRSRDEAARSVGAPVLAAVVRPSSSVVRRLLRRKAPNLQPDHAYRALRVNLTALGLGKTVRRLLVTSSAPDDGKGDAVAGLARTCANAGLRTLVVSADPRRPTPLPLPDGESEVGLMSILRREASLLSAIGVSDRPGLCVVTLGPNPTEGLDLLSSPQFGELMLEASGLFHVVLIDAPAISDGADTTAIGPYADASLMVIRSNSSGGVASSRAAIALNRAGSSVIGVLLVDADPHDATQGVLPPSPALLVHASTNGSGNGHASTAAQPDHHLIELVDKHDHPAGQPRGYSTRE